MDLLGDRIRRAVEGVMGNESLGEGLETESAQSLLDWGIALAQGIAAETGDLDDESAEAVMAPRMKAVRKLMRSVGQWVGGQESLSEADRDFYWGKIVESAAVLYGGQFSPEALDQAKHLPGPVTPSELIARIRELIEQPFRGKNA